jgi:arylsulfatase A-like enzyme
MRSGGLLALVLAIVLGGLGVALGGEPPAPAPARPNILFIALDDLNDWVGCLGGHPQTLTPNLDRLARSGVLFTNAHCAAPQCNPSRSAIFTGVSPHVSGLYDNGQKMREVMPTTEIIPKTLSRQGYQTGGSGKMLHYFIDATSWDTYFPEATGENPFPRTFVPPKRPVSLPVAGPWQYRETDWGAMPVGDAEYGGDSLVSEWVSEWLGRKHESPFFVACGIYRPHEPWFVPAPYFEPFPLDAIQLPPGYRADDLDDLPPEGQRRGPNRYFEHIQKQGQWKQAIQAYLASIHYADAMLGRVLQALEAGPNAKDTIVVLWSDHGWHLGEKEHWQKYTAWRVCTRVPLIVRVPPGVSSLAEGTTPAECDRPVSLVSLFPTLLDLAGLPPEAHHSGPSLVPLLKDPKGAEWPHVAVTFLGDVGSYGLSAQDWRLIHYANGDEELYHIADDPHEWRNLAGDPALAARRAELRLLAPTTFAPKVAPRVESLPELAWHPVTDGQPVPPSRPDGAAFPVSFLNRSKAPVALQWSPPDGGKLKPYGPIPPGGRKSQPTRPGAVWAATDEQGRVLGYFEVGDRTAQAVIPDGAGGR